MDTPESAGPATLSPRAKLTILVAAAVLVAAFLLQVNSILSPFLWALVAAYLLTPIVNYLNIEGHLPRLWSVTLIYASIGLLLLAASRYLYPQILAQGTLFIEDIPRLENSLIALVGPRPLGIDINSVVTQLLSAYTGSTSGKSASHLIANAFVTVIKIFLFLVTTFYLLMDSARIRTAVCSVLPPDYKDELSALGQRINVTLQQYIRGELVLFVIMATVTSIGLTLLGVRGAVFLGLASGALELLPLVGPYTAGALGVSVAYFDGTNPFGWSQTAYAGVVALMYFAFRETEDYLVIPHVLGRAVRLHPLVVLFAVTTGGVLGGLFGLVIAVPVAATLKEIAAYLYAKLLDRPIEFQPIRTLGGGVIEIPVHGRLSQEPDDTAPEETGTD